MTILLVLKWSNTMQCHREAALAGKNWNCFCSVWQLHFHLLPPFHKNRFQSFLLKLPEGLFVVIGNPGSVGGWSLLKKSTNSLGRNILAWFRISRILKYSNKEKQDIRFSTRFKGLTKKVLAHFSHVRLWIFKDNLIIFHES